MITQPKSSPSCSQHSTRTPRVTGTSRCSPMLCQLAGLFDPLAILGHAAAVQQCMGGAGWHQLLEQGVGGGISVYHGKRRFPEASEFSISTPRKPKPLCPTSLPVSIRGPFIEQSCWVSSTDFFRKICQQHKRNHSTALPFYLVMFHVAVDWQCLGRT